MNLVLLFTRKQGAIIIILLVLMLSLCHHLYGNSNLGIIPVNMLKKGKFELRKIAKY